MPTLNHRRGRKQPCELSKWLHLNPLEAGPWAYKLHWLWATSPWAGAHASVAEGHTGPGRDCSVATSHLIILVAEGKDDAGGQTSLGLDQLVAAAVRWILRGPFVSSVLAYPFQPKASASSQERGLLGHRGRGKQATGCGGLSLCLLLWEGPRGQQTRDRGVGAQPPGSQD